MLGSVEIEAIEEVGLLPVYFSFILRIVLSVVILI